LEIQVEQMTKELRLSEDRMESLLKDCAEYRQISENLQDELGKKYM
jgi:hypothetical protein